MSQNKKGFTLIELIIVVIIIGVLASIAAPMMSNMAERAKKTEAITALGTIRTAERMYHVEYNQYVTVIGSEFSSSNPLSQYIPVGALNGRYYHEHDYAVQTGATFLPVHDEVFQGYPSGNHGLYITCFMGLSRATDSHGTKQTEYTMWMLEDGSSGEGSTTMPVP